MRTVRSRVMFFFLHKGANAGLLSGLERKVEFRFERGPGGDFGIAAVDEKTGRAFDMVGAAADVGHAGEFGLRYLAAPRRVERLLGLAAPAQQGGGAGLGGHLPRPLGPPALRPTLLLRSSCLLGLGPHHPSLRNTP